MNTREPKLLVSLSTVPKGADVVLREIAIGHSPLVLIEPLEEDGDFVFKVLGSLIEPAEIGWIMREVGRTLIDEYGEPELDDEATQ